MTTDTFQQKQELLSTEVRDEGQMTEINNDLTKISIRTFVFDVDPFDMASTDAKVIVLEELDDSKEPSIDSHFTSVAVWNESSKNYDMIDGSEALCAMDIINQHPSYNKFIVIDRCKDASDIVEKLTVITYDPLTELELSSIRSDPSICRIPTETMIFQTHTLTIVDGQLVIHIWQNKDCFHHSTTGEFQKISQHVTDVRLIDTDITRHFNTDFNVDRLFKTWDDFSNYSAQPNTTVENPIPWVPKN